VARAAVTQVREHEIAAVPAVPDEPESLASRTRGTAKIACLRRAFHASAHDAQEARETGSSNQTRPSWSCSLFQADDEAATNARPAPPRNRRAFP
jgi:hypothetical protein